MSEETKPLDWTGAKEHLDETIKAYEAHLLDPRVNVTFALNAVLNPLKRRYDSGERTQELYDAMLKVE